VQSRIYHQYGYANISFSEGVNMLTKMRFLVWLALCLSLSACAGIPDLPGPIGIPGI
jgi:hypothetical protein